MITKEYREKNLNLPPFQKKIDDSQRWSGGYYDRYEDTASQSQPLTVQSTWTLRYHSLRFVLYVVDWHLLHMSPNTGTQ